MMILNYRRNQECSDCAGNPRIEASGTARCVPDRSRHRHDGPPWLPLPKNRKSVLIRICKISIRLSMGKRMQMVGVRLLHMAEQDHLRRELLPESEPDRCSGSGAPPTAQPMPPYVRTSLPIANTALGSSSDSVGRS
jgi:hypothetical protein